MEEVLRARLKAMLPGVPVDWNETLQGEIGTRVVLYRISGGADYVMEGPSGLVQARVQVDCHAGTFGTAKALAREVKAAISGWRDGADILGVFLDAERDLQPDAGYGHLSGRVTLDFNIHHQEM
jgi:hypothetical protein